MQYGNKERNQKQKTYDSSCGEVVDPTISCNSARMT